MVDDVASDWVADLLVTVAEEIGEVGERVAGGCQRSDAHPSTHLDDLSVRYGGAGEGHVVLPIDEVPGTGSLREREAPGDVVVVDVRLEHVREAYAVLVEEVEDAVDVALGVDHEGDVAVVHEIAPVAQGRRLDRDDRQVVLVHVRLLADQVSDTAAGRSAAG